MATPRGPFLNSFGVDTGGTGSQALSLPGRGWSAPHNSWSLPLQPDDTVPSTGVLFSFPEEPDISPFNDYYLA